MAAIYYTIKNLLEPAETAAQESAALKANVDAKPSQISLPKGAGKAVDPAVRRDALLVGTKALGYGTVVAVSGFSVLVAATMYRLEIHTLQELQAPEGKAKVANAIQWVARDAEQGTQSLASRFSAQGNWIRPGIEAMQERADKYKEQHDGDVAGMLGLSDTVNWVRDRTGVTPGGARPALTAAEKEEEWQAFFAELQSSFDGAKQLAEAPEVTAGKLPEVPDSALGRAKVWLRSFGGRNQ